MVVGGLYEQKIKVDEWSEWMSAHYAHTHAQHTRTHVHNPTRCDNCHYYVRDAEHRRASERGYEGVQHPERNRSCVEWVGWGVEVVVCDGGHNST